MYEFIIIYTYSSGTYKEAREKLPRATVQTDIGTTTESEAHENGRRSSKRKKNENPKYAKQPEETTKSKSRKTQVEIEMDGGEDNYQPHGQDLPLDTDAEDDEEESRDKVYDDSPPTVPLGLTAEQLFGIFYSLMLIFSY